jgi:hypothetical protein
LVTVHRAEQLADQQRNFANRLRQMYGNQEGNQLQPGMSRQQAVQLGDEKDKMADEFRDLERRTQAAVRDLAGTQRPAASKLRDALGEAQQDELGLRMKANAEWIRRGLGSYAWMREAPITAGLDKLRDNLRDAQNAMQSGNGDPNDMEKRLSQVERLRNQLQQMARQGQQRGNQRGDQPGQQGQQGRTGQQGQQGQEGGGQQGQEGQQGQQGQSGQGGQGGDRGALSRDGYRQGGARDGRFGGAGGPHGGWWGGYRGDWDGRELRDLDPAQIERGYREGLRDLGQLRQAIQDNPDLARDVQDLIREMQRVDPSRVPGNAELIERIQSVVLPAIEQLELQLRRKLEDKNAGQVRTAGSEPVPAGYADAVAEYFRRLSKSK